MSSFVYHNLLPGVLPKYDLEIPLTQEQLSISFYLAFPSLSTRGHKSFSVSGSSQSMNSIIVFRSGHRISFNVIDILFSMEGSCLQ
jgi:hypothetical protein